MYPLFETIKLVDGIPQHLDWHQKRMEKSLHSYYCSCGKISIKDELEIPAAYRHGLYRCKLSYNDVGMQTEFSEYVIRKLKSLKLVYGDEIEYSMKYTDRSVLTKILEQKGSCDDVLIVKNGLISDSSYTNIVLFDGERWCTPLQPLLEGTQRNRLVMETFLDEVDIRVADLKNFRSFKLINAMRDFNDVEEQAVTSIIG